MRSRPVVLVVEDNAELRHVLEEALGSEGYHVLATGDETEALDVLRTSPVDLLISDLTGPNNDDDTIEAVREEFPNLPVVALSDSAGRHPTLFFSSASGGSRGYRKLSKPFRLGELLAVSREVLGPSPDTRPSR